MGQRDLETRPDLRMESLERRIMKLKRTMGRAAGCQQVEWANEIEVLDARYASLAERWSRIDQQGVHATPEERADIAALTDDLAGAVEDAMIRIYLDFQNEAAKAAEAADSTSPDVTLPVASGRRA